MRKTNFLYLLWIFLSVGLLSSCDKDDGDDGSYAIKGTVNSTWGFTSNDSYSEGITIKFSDASFELKVVDFLGETFVTSGRFFSRPPFTTDLVEESTGVTIATMESYSDVDETKQLKIGVAALVLKNIKSNSATPTLTLGANVIYNLTSGEASYVSYPKVLDMSVEINTLDQKVQDVTLTWDAVSGANRYLVYAIKSVPAGAALVNSFPQAIVTGLVAKLSADVTTVTLPRQNPADEIVYYVQSIDEDGVVMASPAAVVKYVETSANAPTAKSLGGNVTVKYVDGKVNFIIEPDLTCKEYRIIQKYMGNDSVVASVTPQMSDDEVTITIDKDIQSNQSFVSGVTYAFDVVGVDYFGIQTAPYSPSFKVLTAPTSFVDGGYNAAGNRILTWNKVAGATSYNVYYSRSSFFEDNSGFIPVVAGNEIEIGQFALSGDIVELTDFNHFFVVPVSAGVEGDISEVLNTVIYLESVTNIVSFNRDVEDEEVSFVFNKSFNATAYDVFYVPEVNGMYDLDNKVNINATFAPKTGSVDVDTAKISISALPLGDYKFYIQAKTDATVSDIAYAGQTLFVPMVKGVNVNATDTMNSDTIYLSWNEVNNAVGYEYSYVKLTELQIAAGDQPDPMNKVVNPSSPISAVDFKTDGKVVYKPSIFAKGSHVYFYVRAIDANGNKGKYNTPATFVKK